MPLVHLLYASRPSGRPSSRDLASILEQARRRNLSDGITGLLCYGEEWFLQLLEDRRDAVCRTFYRILADSRHRDVRLLQFLYPAERRFAQWSMGFAGIGDVSREALEKHAPAGSFAALAEEAPAALDFMYDLANQGTA